MALTDQIVESHTRTDTAVGATSAALSSVTISQADGASTTGRYQLHAAVAVSSSSANVEITGLSFGSEDMAPSKSSEVTTAGARPATRMFSAGEWPTGAQTPTVTVSGGNIDAVVVYFFVLDEVAEECLPPFGDAPRSDTFNRLSINPMWTLDQGDGSGATAQIVNNSGIYSLEIFTEDTTVSHFGGRGASLQQSVGNVDIDVGLQKDTIGPDDGPLEGIVAEVSGDGGTYVIGSHYDFSGAAVYFARYNGGSETSIADEGSTDAESEWPRLERSGNTWEFFDSTNGSTYNSIDTHNFTMTLARVGIGWGSFLGVTRTSEVQQFIDRNATVTRTPQDGDTALQFLSTNAASATSASLAFTENTTEGAGLVDIGIIAASEAAGAISAGTGDELIASGLVSSTDGIRYAIVGALTEVSGTTAGTTISGSWTGSAPVSMSGDQYRVEALAGGATNVDVGLASETNTAQSITPRHIVDVGLAEETDTAQSITPAAAATIVNVGLASETNAAQSITPSKRADVGLASETNTAQSITPSHRVDVGLATETDSAQAITIERRVTVGLAEETDTAQSVTIERRVQVGLAEETDSALDVQPVGQGSVSVNQAEETDQALSIRPQRVLDVGLAEETDTAQDITPSGPATVAIGLATESNTALPVTAARIVDVGLAEETDSAQPITVRREFLLGLAEETNTALPVDALGTRVIELGLAEETNSAFSMVALGGVAAAPRNRGAGAGGNRSRSRQSLAQVRGFIQRQRDDEEALIMSLLAEDP